MISVRNILLFILCPLAATSVPAIDNPEVVWTFQTGCKIYASPIVHEQILYIGSDDGIFYALNAATGQEKWRYQTIHPIRSTAVVSGANVIFNNAKAVYALNRQSGALAWNFTFPSQAGTGESDPWDYFWSSPVVQDNVVYIGGGDGTIYGLDSNNGANVFQYQTAGKAIIRTRPVVRDNTLYCADWNGTMYAVDLATGSTLWTFSSGAPVQSSPALLNSAIFFGGRSTEVYSLNSSTGALDWKWRDPIGSWIGGTPVIENGIVYIGGSDNHLLSAFDAATGTIQWQCKADYNIFTTPIILENSIIFTSGYSGTMAAPNPMVPGSLFIIDKSTGSIKSQFQPPANIFSSPVLDNGLIYFGCSDGKVYAVDHQVLTSRLFPDIQVDESILRLGTLSIDTDTSFTVQNSGSAADSISLTLYYHKITNQNGFRVEPVNFVLQPGTSRKIAIRIKPELLAAGTFYPKITITSTYNLATRTFLKQLRFTVPTGLSVKNRRENPESFRLLQNYPNPFNNATRIDYYLPATAHVSLIILNVYGQEVTELVNQVQNAGVHSIIWQGKDKCGNTTSSGIYYCSYSAGENNAVRKLVLIK